VAGFIQQLAVQYVTHGYWWYVAGHVPEGRDATKTDRKLIEQYDVELSRWARSRRKRAGRANVQYLRHERFFVIVATAGEHEFYRREPNVRDIRKVPVKYAGYSVSYRRSTVTGKGHASVRLAPAEYKLIRAHLLDKATHWSAERLSAEFYMLSFEPYAPVRRQLLNLLRAVNRERKVAGFELVPDSCLHLKRRVVKPFGEPPASGSALEEAA